VLGLGEDLQPGVTRPGLTIASGSDLTKYGKVPSIIKADGTVCGISGWAQKHATPEQLEAWAQNPDYGICLITRHVRAFDVDVKDPLLAVEIRELLEQYFGAPLFYRARRDSSKFLVPFVCPGEFAKRIMTVAGGEIVEWLATGQQFLAAGVHQDGERYEWRPSLPCDLPVRSLGEADAFWETVLGPAFAKEPLKPRRRVRLGDGERKDKMVNKTSQDPVAQYLIEHGWVRE
jgi:hypothetical protein